MQFRTDECIESKMIEWHPIRSTVESRFDFEKIRKVWVLGPFLSKCICIRSPSYFVSAKQLLPWRLNQICAPFPNLSSRGIFNGRFVVNYCIEIFRKNNSIPQCSQTNVGGTIPLQLSAIETDPVCNPKKYLRNAGITQVVYEKQLRINADLPALTAFWISSHAITKLLYLK